VIHTARTILLTGATGFVGSRVLDRLLRRGDRVVAIVRDPAKLRRTDRNLTVVQADLGGPLPDSIAIEADALVHAAACTDFEADPEELMRVNRDGTRRITELAIRSGVRRAVLVSSDHAAGPARPAEIPRPEGAGGEPATNYGRSKLAGEQVFTELLQAAGIEPTILRPACIIGDGELGFVRIVLNALRNEHPMLGQEWRNHRWQSVHVADVVEAIDLALRYGGAGTFNLTNGTTPTVGQVTSHVAAIAADFGMGVDAQPEPPEIQPISPERIHYANACTRAVAEWNWGGRRTFPQTVIELAESLGLSRTRGARPPLRGPLKVILVNTPSEGLRLSRDMAGGLGFVHKAEDRFPPLDLLWWIARLEQQGWPVELADGSVEAFEVGDLLAHMAETGTDVVVCEVNLPTFETDVLFLQALRRHSRARVVAKTQLTHPLFLERLLKEAGIDFVIVGECDLTIDRVLAGDDHRGTARLVGDEVKVVEEEKLQDLDRLPHPARHRLAKDAYSYSLLGQEGFTTIQSSRGCPYSCGYYCPYPMTQGVAWRARSARHVVAEIENAFALGYRRFLFRDATFTLNRKRTVEICELLLEKGLPITFWCETRINCLDSELLALLARAGCKGINFGLESGSDDVLASGAKQGVNVQRIRQVLDDTARVGIVSHLLVAVGLPQETRSSIRETYVLLGELPARSLGVTGITPFPGTELWYDAMRNNWVKSTDWREYGGNGTVMVTDHLTQEDMRFAARMMFDYFQMTRPGSGATKQQIADHRAAMDAWVAEGLPAARVR
jgi:nucleoside-diphosphate-sugar epimerase